ncbi:glycoside hydrolase family 99-like domain-containing protein [Geobacillus zalihae]|uniref:Glycoside hydrolase family 99-like domain-containing protein n=1 Tax=Geobacillus zalihae TaxID=213419 RepID=A0A7H1RSL5_9BACL|nr:glycoside hydrolase family 99-like domain-containing protein [Geobacillus zalihae]QNU17254.1 glycoside hydrolase family 99-like domain-containing protein [Geobacillus zalihae]
MKIIAFYLPQFHEIEENNRWWGKGFTEWTNLKKAKPLAKNHYQPRIPLNENYYDLTDDNVRIWQEKLAREYGIYGFCYYHYWFRNGKKLLEKPMEMMLENKNIKLPFCISWANEPWTRSWDGKYGEVLMEQEYGDEPEWIEHFDYLYKFFRDDRYIKVDGKPLFIIYKSSSIKKCQEMMELWNRMAIDRGLNGIYFVNTLRSRKIDKRDLPFSACVEFEPAYSTSNLPWYELNIRRVYRYSKKLFCRITGRETICNLPMDYDRMTELSLQKRPLKDLKTIPGAFVNWDNTPRKGIMGTYYKNFSVKKFEDYLTKKIEKGIKEYKSEFLFINAWNEWCEGAYLEPDGKNGYGYLEAVRNALINNGIRI